MKKNFKGSTRRVVATVVLCTLLFNTLNISVYADGEDTQTEENLVTPTPAATQQDNSNNDELNTENVKTTEGEDGTDAEESDLNETENEPSESDNDEKTDDELSESAGDESPEELGDMNENHEHVLSDWTYDGNERHIRFCTDEECDYSETYDCTIEENLVEEGDAYYIVRKCADCHHVFNKWQVTPTITNVSPDKDDNTSYFKSPITVSAQIYCKDIERDTENLTDEEKEDKYKQNINVQVAVKNLITEKNIFIDADLTCKDGIVTATCLIPNVEEDKKQDGVFYAVAGITATNNRCSQAVCKYPLNYGVFIPNPDEENQKVTFEVIDNDEVSYNTDELMLHWFSNKGNDNSVLKAKISGVSDDSEGVTIDSFSEIDNNDEVIRTFETYSLSPRTYQVPYEIDFWIWHFTGYRNKTTYDYEYKLPMVDGIHKYEVIYKVAGKQFTKTFQTKIDNTTPEITSITYNNEKEPVGSSGANKGYYKEKVKVVIKVTENNLTNNEALDGISLHNDTTGQDIKFIVSEVDSDSDNGRYTFVATAESDGKYSISGSSISDLAGNKSNPLSSESFIIDTKSPVATIEFDNENVKNSKYYNASRTATITVIDENFAADESDLKINEKLGKAQIGSWESVGSNTYVQKITFAEDGFYDIAFSCKDKAANSSETKNVAEFVIDTTKPEISVSFDNNSVKNGMYYNAKRTATVTFKDFSFSESLVNVTQTGDNALPSLGGYTNSDYKYETSMTFENDGKYGFKIVCEDLAGNVSESYSSDIFVIDTTAPELDIAGVADMSANNGTVEPTINVTDTNFKDSDVTITVTGSNNGEISVNKTTGTITGGYTFKLADMPHEKSVDDLYTLVAKVTDQAGNETEKKIQYSVNRFGSVYVLSDATKSMIDGYYVTSPQDVIITEINVDTLSYKEVSVTYDGNVRELTEGRGYQTSDLTNNNGWHSISYTVGKNNFSRDGIYSVTIYSEDKATNRQSNQSKDAQIEFLVDMTAPSVVVSGIESDGVYEESNHDFSFNVTDTIGVKEISVYLDEKELASFSGKNLLNNGGTEVLTIPGKDDYQQLVIVSSDVAGNETRLSFNNILISEKAKELEASGEIEKKAIEDEAVAKAGSYSMTDIPMFAWWLLIIIVVAVTTGGIVAYKKAKKSK